MISSVPQFEKLFGFCVCWKSAFSEVYAMWFPWGVRVETLRRIGIRRRASVWLPAHSGVYLLLVDMPPKERTSFVVSGHAAPTITITTR